MEETRLCEAETTARNIFQVVITNQNYALPQTYAQLLEIVEHSGALVFWCHSLPASCPGVQMGDILFVSGAEDLSDFHRMRVLAHEWCHWLREKRYGHRRQMSLYQGDRRGHEEAVARAFERLF